MERTAQASRRIEPPPRPDPARQPPPFREAYGVARAGGVTPLLIACYLGAAVAANLAVGAWGPAVLPLTAFLLIPFDLVARDVLHERWGGRWLWPKMAALVAAGSLLSFTASPAAARVAAASAVSFALAGAADALAYHLLRDWPRRERMNLSNVCAASVDSLAFPLVAFGSTTLWLSLGQAGTKVAGGYLWTLAFVWALRRRRAEAAHV